MNKRFLSTGIASICLVAVLTIATPRAEASFGDFLRSIFGRGGQEASVMRAETTPTKQVAPTPTTTTNRGTTATTNTAPVNPTGTGLIVQCNGSSASAISLCEEICVESGGTPDSSGTTGNCLVASLSSVPGNIFNGATGVAYQAKPTTTKPVTTVTTETKQPTPAVVTTPKPLCGASSLCLGMKTPAVKTMQQKLVTLKYLASADGSFGPATEKAVKAFQTKKGMTADGIVGPKTLQRMDDDVVAMAGRIDPNDGTGPYNPITYDKKLKPIRKIFNILGLASINSSPTDLNPTGINPSTSVWVSCNTLGLVACQSAGNACFGYPIEIQNGSAGCNTNQTIGTNSGFTEIPVNIDPTAMYIFCGPNTFFTCGELFDLCVGEGGSFNGGEEAGYCNL